MSLTFKLIQFLTPNLVNLLKKKRKKKSMFILTEEEKELQEQFSFTGNDLWSTPTWRRLQPSNMRWKAPQPISSPSATVPFIPLYTVFFLRYYAVCFIKLQIIILHWVVTCQVLVQNNVYLSHGTLELRYTIVTLTTVRRITLPWQKLLWNPIIVNESPFNFLIIDCHLFKNYWHSATYAFLEEDKRILEIYSIQKDTSDFITFSRAKLIAQKRL